MGNEVDSKFRGAGDIPLANCINALTDEEFAQFLKEGDAAGCLDAQEYPDKYELIEALPSFDEELKVKIMENLTAGKKPFE